MKALRFLLFSCFTFAMMVSLSWQAEELLPSNDICRLFKSGTKLRKPGTCDEGIVCQNFVSTPGVKCPKWYSLDSSKCVARQPPDDSYCEAPCKSKSPTFVADEKDCSGWYQCNGKEEISRGKCPAGQIFDQKKQMCTYDDSSNCIASYNFCDVVPKGIPFQNENDCGKYYVCNRRRSVTVAERHSCESGKYFDRETGECLSKYVVPCNKIPYPENVCGDTKIAYRNRFVSDGATCRGYFYCKDLGVGKPDTKPIWGQCSMFDEFFNPAIQACQDRNHVKCFENRCEGRGKDDDETELSSRKGCQHYWKCENGFPSEEVYCGDGLYYDAENAKCTSDRKQYGACV